MSMIRSRTLCLIVLAVLVVVELCFAEVPPEISTDDGLFSKYFLIDLLEVVSEVLLIFWITVSKFGRRRRNRKPTRHDMSMDWQSSCEPEASHDKLPTLLGARNASESFRPSKKHLDCKDQHFGHAAERSPLSETLHACVQQGDLTGACDALKRVSQFGNPSMEDYKAVITLCAKNDEPELAHLWLRTAAGKTGVLKTPVCYNAVMNAYAKRGDVARAVTVATGMMKAGVSLDIVSYNTLIDASSRVGDADTAEEWMRHMEADGIKASVISFSLVMRACAFAGRSKSAESWLEQADKQGIELNTISYSAIISAFAKNQDLQSANTWLDIMVSRGVVASVHCFTSILHALVHQGDMQQAAQLVERMRAAGVHLDVGVYSLLVQGALRVDDVQTAHSWAHEAVANGILLPRSARSMLKLTHWMPRKASDDSSSTEICTSSQRACGTAGLSNSQFATGPTFESGLVGKRFNGTIKEFVPDRFGHITCDETHSVYHRDVYLSSQNNPEGFVKGQRVSFTLYLDKTNKFPRAYDLRPYQVN